ncbi:MAG: twin-arginine translocase TatA/TatE family subunit [Hyphomicrobium sp.]|uniref:twin-arginine translocase TatA/TatE family subunit n=1 Tax=Hyphomicrobium sp. TaxID=82 RepID=UPI001327E489|nr:twin-arginine translocase TatA/TatE family subunit [Hyphomicrobium sp.]KAB2941249.1 MAG: twin-arginine translocase TatA/TatE family subunit [Hyphomicrobium sp.]MBZ0211574.1 twin-arginine translocase TatA/TatE family subunit [Hyphomicrobium sp.]
MGLSGWHLLILALVALLIFGGSGRISSIMGDMAKGIKSFKKGLSEDDDTDKPEARPIEPRVIDQRPVKSSERDTTKTG